MASLALILVATVVNAQIDSPVVRGYMVKFAIRNFRLAVNGSFSGLRGKLNFHPANPAAAFISATVATATINTGNGTRNAHLR